MLAWMDLEMTGLDPAQHVIVEIATLVTDDQLNIVAEGPDLVIAATRTDLQRMSPVVRQMHEHSGLLTAIEASSLSLPEAGKQTLEFLRDHLPEPGTVPLAGNSIGTDRRFLAAQLPELDDWFHYRSVDVSSIKELGRRWFPEMMATAPSKRGTHRAMDDIRESIAELAYYRDAIFREPTRESIPGRDAWRAGPDGTGTGPGRVDSGPAVGPRPGPPGEVASGGEVRREP